MLNALAGISWVTEKGDFTADLQRMGEIYCKVCCTRSTNANDSNFKKIQTVQNAALRMAMGAHKMASIEHLH